MSDIVLYENDNHELVDSDSKENDSRKQNKAF